MGTLEKAVASRMRIGHEDPAALTLDERGMICDCSKAAERLLCCLRSDLVWRHVSLLLPQFVEGVLMQDGQLNPRISFLCHCGHLFQVQGPEGRAFSSELRLFELNNSGRRTVRLILCPVDL